MSVNHFPYIPRVNSDESGKQSLYPDGDSDRHQIFNHLFTGPLPTWNFHANPFGSFCAKLLTGKQTDNDENIYSNNKINKAIVLHFARAVHSRHPFPPIGDAAYRQLPKEDQVRA